LRHGFLGCDGGGHTSTLQQVNCQLRVKSQEWALEIKRRPARSFGEVETHTFAKSTNEWGTPLGIPQGGVSRLERRTDMYVSTLRNYIRAMGGELKITAVFPNGAVEISQFQDVEREKNA
jgi:hypothetical protein